MDSAETTVPVSPEAASIPSPTPFLSEMEAPAAGTGKAIETDSATVQTKGEESVDADASTVGQAKRFIPEHKKPDAALTFPEKLMNLMKLAEKEDEASFCVAWLPDGKSFVIRNPDEFTRQILPKFFKATKFSSFTRKLYRWGFRQVNRGIGPDDPIIFGNEYFQRDNLELMTKMRSITAASTRKQSNMEILAQKRVLESMEQERNNKRVLLGQFMQQQKNAMHPAMFKNPGMNLAQALRPFDNNAFNGIGGMPFDMFTQSMNANNPLMNAFPQGGLGGLAANQGQQQYSNTASTADIVNAAINALRFAP